jgi:hypothetical protein
VELNLHSPICLHGMHKGKCTFTFYHINGIFLFNLLYDFQVYPTPLRAVGVGTCSAMARLGAMVTPYVAQVGNVP